MAAISSPGLGSGLDVNSIVSQLVEATRTPVDTRNDDTQERYDAQISDLGRVRSALSDLNDTLFDLRLPTTFSRRNVEHSSSNFEVEAGSAALPASYDVKVDKVATSQRITSPAYSSTESIGAGTLTIIRGFSSSTGLADSDIAALSINVVVTASDTLETIASKINSYEGNEQVVASVVKGDSGSHLIFESLITGEAGVLEVAVTDDDNLNYDNSGLSRLAFQPKETVLDETFSAGELLNADGISNGIIQLSNGLDVEDISLLSTDTIEDAVTKINANSIGVFASLEDDGAGNLKLVLTSDDPDPLSTTPEKEYGEHKIGISIVSDDDGDSNDSNGISRLAHEHSYLNYDETKEASNAQITINDTITTTSSSNRFEDVITGVIITAQKAHETSDSSESIEIDLDSSSTKEAITKFVEAYNTMLETMSEVTNSDENSGELGSLTGDNTIRNFLTQARRVIGAPVEVRSVQLIQPNSEGEVVLGGSVATNSLSYLTLSTLGISTQRDGSLSIDESTLDQQIEQNYEHFSTFFSHDGGLARELSNIVGEYRSTGGIVDNKIQTLNRQLDRLNDQREEFDDRMVRYEARLFSQFNAMDLIVANLNSTSQYLEGALGSLPGVVRNNDS